jgi:hypothetical protein
MLKKIIIKARKKTEFKASFSTKFYNFKQVSEPIWPSVSFSIVEKSSILSSPWAKEYQGTDGM